MSFFFIDSEGLIHHCRNKDYQEEDREKDFLRQLDLSVEHRAQINYEEYH
jgi:hypothetical protein